MSIATADRRAVTDAEIHDLLVERWSPRAFVADSEVTDAQLDSLLEAARWAPSAGNQQHRRFIVGRRGTPVFDRIFSVLNDGNKTWAGQAGALVLGITVTDGPMAGTAQYDLGQAIAHLTVQAHALGLHVHQMTGFSAEAATAEFELPANLAPFSVTAIGELAAPDTLPEALAERERAPRQRLGLDELVLARS